MMSAVRLFLTLACVATVAVVLVRLLSLSGRREVTAQLGAPIVALHMDDSVKFQLPHGWRLISERTDLTPGEPWASQACPSDKVLDHVGRLKYKAMLGMCDVTVKIVIQDAERRFSNQEQDVVVSVDEVLHT